MNTKDWKTHCFGRHSVTLPRTSRIKAFYTFRTHQIAPLSNAGRDGFMDLVSKAESESKSRRHRTAGTMFVSRIEQKDNFITLVELDNEMNTDLGYRFTTYFATPDWMQSYCYQGGVGPRAIDFAKRLRQTDADSLHALLPGQIPNEPGYCFQHAYFAQSERGKEDAQLTFSLTDRPGVSFDISTYTQARAQESLLDRSGGFLASLLGSVAGLHTLRRRSRDVGPIPGEEILTAAREDGQRLYAFKWESPGKGDWNLAEPNVNASMGVLAMDRDIRPAKPPFADDDEALEMWDAIVGSIRLRPGAVA